MARVGPSRDNGRGTTLQFGTDCAPGASPPPGDPPANDPVQGEKYAAARIQRRPRKGTSNGATPEFKAEGALTTPESQHNSETDVFLQAEAWLAQNQPSKKAARRPPGQTRLTAPSSGPHLDKLINHISRKGEQKRRQRDREWNRTLKTSIVNHDSLSDEPALAREAGGGSRVHGGSADPACVDSSRVAHNSPQVHDDVCVETHPKLHVLQASGETNEQGGDPDRGPPLDWGKLTDSQQERIRCRLRRPPFRTRKRGGRVPDEIREADVKGFVQQAYTQTSYVVGPAAELAAQEQPQAPDQLADTRPHQPHQPKHVFRIPYSRTCPPSRYATAGSSRPLARDPLLSRRMTIWQPSHFC